MGLEIVPFKERTFVGGLANNVVLLSKGLSKRGHDIFILTSDFNGRCGRELNETWATIKFLRVHGTYGSVSSALEFLTKVIPGLLIEHSRRKFDILHLNSAYPVFGIVSLLSKTLVRVPNVFTLYSPIQLRPLKDRKGIYQRFSSAYLSRFFLSGATVIAVSQNVKRSLVSAGFKEGEIAFLPPVVKTTEFDSALRTRKRSELGITEETPLLLYCGSWTRWKGISVLLESVSNVRNAFPNVKLIIAWGEPHNWYDECKIAITRQIETFGLRDNIIEVGIVTDMDRLMASCDIFIAPFLNTDGVADYPVSILEAMSCGTLVIACKVGGIPEVITHGENGLLFEPGNVRDLTDSILFALKNRERARTMEAKAAVFAQQNFAADFGAERLENVYAQILRQER